MRRFAYMSRMVDVRITLRALMTERAHVSIFSGP